MLLIPTNNKKKLFRIKRKLPTLRINEIRVTHSTLSLLCTYLNTYLPKAQ